MLGLAFLTKETSGFWLPLPLLLMLLAPQLGVRARHVAVFLLAFACCAAPWSAWVFWHTGYVYKLEGLDPPLLLGAGAAIAAAAALALTRLDAVRARPRRWLGATLLAAWLAASLFVLESRPEPHAFDYLRSVPDWSLRVLLPSMEPWPLVLAAWVLLALRARANREAAAVLGIGVLLGAPMLIFTANAGWEPRQVVWLTYLSYAVLAWALLELAGELLAAWSASARALTTIAAAGAIAAIAGFASAWAAPSSEPSAVRDWHGEDERAISAWLDDLPDGSSVLASRLFHSQLYVDHGGRLRIEQLPTLALRIDDTGAPHPLGSMFRYDDADLDLDDGRSWIWLGVARNRAYYAGLAYEDLLGELESSGAGYLLITGEDGGFSSAQLAHFASRAPRLRLLREREDGHVRAYLFAISTGGSAPPLDGTIISGDDLARIAVDHAGASIRPEFWEELAPHGAWLDGTEHLDSTDLAALAGYYVEGE